MVLFMAIINLRGVKESGRIFAVPTYIFLGSMALTLVAGFARWATGDLDVLTDAPPILKTAVTPLTAFLVLRAFSSGCTALTGVEAISNGIPAFEEPRSHNAATTLTWMSVILGTIFLSITFLAHYIGATPSDMETVISQLGRAVWGRGWGQIGLLAATTLILIMAANTSFADFPRLAALAATDGFLPRQLAYRGSRLVFSWGITFLAGMAIFLLIILRANTSRLIPLYAIGVFLSFTLSQSGMVLRWLKVGRIPPGETGHSAHGTTLLADRQWRLKMVVNGFGGVLTAVVMLVFAVTKFRDGAWFVVILIPTLVMIFLSIHRHYQRVASQLSLGDAIIAPHASPVKTILLVDDVHAGTLRLVNFALSMGQPWEAVHVAIDPERTVLLKQKWAKRVGQAELKILPSPYRSIAGPLRSYLLSLREEDPRMFIHLLL
ncbi:MAG: APC family permease, partial [Anaerolineae bacterium]